MFRKINTHIKYEKDGIKIRPVSLDEKYEVGGWNSSYSGIKIGYEYDKDKRKNTDITYAMINQNEIIGYFISHGKINLYDHKIIPLYGKELVLYDFAVDIRAYIKYSKVLIDYMINYAIYNGYNVITINKTEKFNNFYIFLRKYYKIKETVDNIYLIIENPKIRTSQKYLFIYKNDLIKIEELYFLYDLNFNIMKTKCELKLNEEKIIIDRLTSEISFPKNVKLVNDKVILNSYTKFLIYLVVSMYHLDNIKDIIIDYNVNNPNYYEATIDGLLYVSKNLTEIRNDIKYVNLLIEKDYAKVVPNYFKYDFNERTFLNSKVIYKLK